MNEELKNELNELQSPLAEMDKHYFANQSEVPADYFSSMEDRFIQFIKENESPREAKQISIFDFKRITYSVAAVSAFAILGLGILTIMRSGSDTQLSENEVKTFLEEEGDFLALENSTLVEPYRKLEKLSDNEIKDYLCEVEGMDCGQVN
jgi:hypothetical protein